MSGQKIGIHIQQLQESKYNVTKSHESNLQQKKFKESLDELNATLLTKLLEPIYETIEPDPLTGGGFAEKTLNYFLINEYSKKITENGKYQVDPNLNNQLMKKYNNEK
ncbi:hypothetical protein [Candidatus Aquarickettsia rohweri]|uniref:Flagellar protein FlgJ N-terminal domain-containing protein n=1 Tax=Candidatus Aquarickettsia rohweri TaxID=2602574 RepID=A0A429XGL2_9RICK|nr:hypothetical protein [Candidatus Aquarickettsia rohweri]MSO14119.1 hypothetical protein [Rickettsiales endosymbiont of Trichoplax sp. H2]RST64417.1 hypothetical protein EIC27_04790 [Candidatus Aquarickettsia rohweri]